MEQELTWIDIRVFFLFQYHTVSISIAIPISIWMITSMRIGLILCGIIPMLGPLGQDIDLRRYW